MNEVLLALGAAWTTDIEEIPRKYGRRLREAIKNNAAADNKNQLEEAGEAAPAFIDSFNELGNKDLEDLLREQWPLLSWTTPESLFGSAKYNGQIKIAELLRNPHLIVSLFHFEAGVLLPQHAKTACELVHILSGSKAKLGPIQEWVKEVRPEQKRFYEFLPTAPQVIQAGEDAPLLYVSVWSLDDAEKEWQFWFSDITKGNDYTKDIMAIQNVEEYYNKMASDYEDSMSGWGYCMPEAIADALVKHGGLKVDASILDLGCGNGLSGQALFNRGIRDLNGLDFSSEMLKQCAKRACYQTLQRADLLEPLPFEDNLFDCLLSVAVTTYLNPSVLELWIRAAKHGGIISFTHKTSVWPDWEKEQDRLETELKVWKKVWVSHPIPYLPSLKEQGPGDDPCTEMAKVYIYRKL